MIITSRTENLWEQRKLGEISETYSGGTPKVSIKSFYNKKEIPFIRSSDIHKNTTELYITKEGLEESSAKLVSKGQILYALYGATSGEVDISKIDGAINQAILAINTHDNINYFIMLFLNKNKGKIIKKYIQGGQGNLSAKIVKNINVNITSKKEEKEISTFIKKFEKIFTLYDRKLKLLSQVKKYFLDNLFAEKEYPNLRFKGFTDAWEQRKLENLSEHKSGTSIEKYFSSDGLYKVISIGSYGLNNEYIDQGIRAVKNKTTESKLVRSGQLTMVLNDKTANGNLIGRCLLISTDNEFIVNQRTEIIIPGPDLNGNYAYYYLNGPFRSKVKRIAQGGTQIYVNYSSVKKQKINYPIKDEQIKISKLLKIIKKLITLYENKQQHLTKIKKTLLNTMFI